MRVAVCPGTFDPITVGHVDIITRAARRYDVVYAAILVNPAKTPMFSLETRLEFMRQALAHLRNVRVESYDGWLADYAAQKDACAIVKGVRNDTDRLYEENMAAFNEQKDPQAKTVLLNAKKKYSGVSSTAVRALLEEGQDASVLLPPQIAAQVQAEARRLQEKREDRR